APRPWMCLCSCAAPPRRPHSFPTRRSSDLQATDSARFADGVAPHRPLGAQGVETGCDIAPPRRRGSVGITRGGAPQEADHPKTRSEEHTSELQSRENLVCRLLLEKEKT